MPQLHLGKVCEFTRNKVQVHVDKVRLQKKRDSPLTFFESPS